MTCIFPASPDVVTCSWHACTHTYTQRERERDYTFELLLSAVKGAIELSSNVNETELFKILPSLAKYTVSGEHGTNCKMKKFQYKNATR